VIGWLVRGTHRDWVGARGRPAAKEETRIGVNLKWVDGVPKSLTSRSPWAKNQLEGGAVASRGGAAHFQTKLECSTTTPLPVVVMQAR
jgi:hypothetical protein